MDNPSDLHTESEVEIKGDSSASSSLTDRLGAGPRTKHIDTRGTFGCKNEYKTETPVSRRCLQRRTAQMLERSQSLVQYCNNTANLQD